MVAEHLDVMLYLVQHVMQRHTNCLVSRTASLLGEILEHLQVRTLPSMQGFFMLYAGK